MRSARHTVCLMAAALALAAPGCAGSGQDPAEGLVSNVDKARNAASLSALQTGLVTLGLIQAENPGAPVQSLVAALQARDATNRYTTAAPTDAGIIQVLGGGGQPVMLVAISSAPGSGREPYYLAAWQDGGNTRYYVGRQAPPYSAQEPTGAGWSTTPPL
jgi:hypothetical protein